MTRQLTLATLLFAALAHAQLQCESVKNVYQAADCCEDAMV